MKLGFAPAALPLWEQILSLLTQYKAQLEAFIPAAMLAQHLQKLAALYEAQSPLLAEVCNIWATSLAEGPGILLIALNSLTHLSEFWLFECKNNEKVMRCSKEHLEKFHNYRIDDVSCRSREKPEKY